MPIIDHGTQAMPEPVDKKRARSLIAAEHGARSLAIREMLMDPGSESRLHSHPTDQAIMVTEGSIQMVVADEVRTVRRGFTLLAPPGVPHKLINNTWVTATMLIIYPTVNLETDYLE